MNNKKSKGGGDWNARRLTLYNIYTTHYFLLYKYNTQNLNIVRRSQIYGEMEAKSMLERKIKHLNTIVLLDLYYIN